MTANWLLITVLVIIVIFAVRGWRRGFLRLLYDLASIVAAVVLAGYALAASDSLAAGIAAVLVIMVILYFIGRLLLKVNKIPVIGKLNQAAGIIAGFLFGLAVVWFIFMIISAASFTPMGEQCLSYIDQSLFLKYLYENNSLMQLLAGSW